MIDNHKNPAHVYFIYGDGDGNVKGKTTIPFHYIHNMAPGES